MNSSNFSEAGFWNKIKKHAVAIGGTLIEHALCLFYAAQDPATPIWAKMRAYAALGYLISPFDLVPDLLPGGYVDDAAGVALAYASLLPYMTQEIQTRAKATVRSLFGDLFGPSADPVTA